MTNDLILALMAAHLLEYPDAEFRLRGNSRALTIELVHTVRVPGRTERTQVHEGAQVLPGEDPTWTVRDMISSAVRMREELLQPKPEPREDPLPADNQTVSLDSDSGARGIAGYWSIILPSPVGVDD